MTIQLQKLTILSLIFLSSLRSIFTTQGRIGPHFLHLLSDNAIQLTQNLRGLTFNFSVFLTSTNLLHAPHNARYAMYRTMKHMEPVESLETDRRVKDRIFSEDPLNLLHKPLQKNQQSQKTTKTIKSYQFQSQTQWNKAKKQNTKNQHNRQKAPSHTSSFHIYSLQKTQIMIYETET